MGRILPQSLTSTRSSGEWMAMANAPLDDLPLVRRLALSYAPSHMRAQVLALLALDQRLSLVVSTGNEPMLAQIKLAWWRERLQEGPAQWPQGEPLLAQLTCWRGETAALVPLVDSWEYLLADRLTEGTLNDYAEGRAHAWQLLAPAEHAESTMRMGKAWALADLAFHMGEEGEGQLVRGMLGRVDARLPRLPKTLRSLAVLHGLTRRALAKGSSDLLDGPAAGLVALRIGLTGR